MPTTNFVNRVTPITAEWLNDVDAHVFQGKDFTGSVFNVVDPIYGADPTGAADSTLAIQTAINAASATSFGGTVYFPPGVYKITASLTIPTLVHLVGDGYDNCAIRYYGAGGTAIKLEGTSPSPVVKLSLRGFAVYDYGTGVNGINMSYCHYSKLQDLRVYGFTVGVSVAHCWNDIFDNILAESNTQDGFNLSTTDANALLFTACQGIVNGRAGFYCEGGRAIDVVGCTWEANTQYGVYLSGGAANRPLNVVFQGNYIEGNGTYEVYLESATAYVPYGIVFRDCYFEFIAAKAAQAIRVVDVNMLVIDGCTFDNQGGNYDYSLYMAAGGTNSGVRWGKNLDLSTNGVYSEVLYENEKSLEARAWGRFVITGGAIASSNSFGVSTITRISAGVYEITLAQAMPGTNFTIVASAENGASYTGLLCSPGQPSSTTVFRITTSSDASTVAEARTVNFVVYA